MQVTLTKITHFTKDKDGNELKGKNGKSYTRCLINTIEHGERPLSGFGNAITKGWSEGDKLDLAITEKEYNGKTYLNFDAPRPAERGGLSEQDRNLLIRLELGLTEILKILKRTDGSKEAGNKSIQSQPIEYPAEEISPDDIPF